MKPLERYLFLTNCVLLELNKQRNVLLALFFLYTLHTGEFSKSPNSNMATDLLATAYDLENLGEFSSLFSFFFVAHPFDDPRI